MRSLNATFAAEMAKITGAAPRTVVEFGFATPLLASDQDLEMVETETYPVAYAVENQIELGGDIYKQTGGSGNFVGLGQSINGLRGVSANPVTGDVYACASVGDIYKQTGGTGNFVALGQTPRSWYAIAVNPTTGDVYACEMLGDIYKQTAGAGSFVALGQTARVWTGLSVNPVTGDVFACAAAGDIYKQTAGAGNFVGLGQTTRNWWGVSVNPLTDDVYACVQDGDIYKQTGGTGNFIGLGQTSRKWHGVSVNPVTSDVYATTNNADPNKDVYKQTAGAGSFVGLGQTGVNWEQISAVQIPAVVYTALGLVNKWDFIDSSAGQVPGRSIIGQPEVSDLDLELVNTRPKSDLFAVVYGGDIYRQINSAGTFNNLNQSTSNWVGLCAAPDGDVYACVSSGDIYKQAGGEGGFSALLQTNRAWRGMAATSADNIYASVYGGDIYMQTGGTGDFVALGETSRNWRGMCASPGGDVYACVATGDIYKQTAGSGAFAALSQTSRNWYGMAAAPNGDIYACVDSGDVYKQTGGSGDFVALGLSDQAWRGLAVNDTGELFGSTWAGKIYKITRDKKLVALSAGANWLYMASSISYRKFTDYSTTSDPLEGVTVTLYQWYAGTPWSTREPLFVGTVRGRVKYNELTARIQAKGIWEKYNRVIGADLLLSEADYPGLAPDHVGLMANIGYGPLANVPCRAVEGGSVDNLAAAITAGQTTIELSDGSKFGTSGTATVGSDTFTWSGKTGNTLTGCSARAAGYSAGEVVFVVQTYYVYQVAGHPVKTLKDLSVEGFIVTSAAILYTGQSGDSYTGYTGQAVAVLPAYITRAQAATLLQDNGVSSADATALLATIPGAGNVTISDVIALFNAIGVGEDLGVSTGSHGHTGTEAVIVWKFDKIASNSGVSWSEFVIDANQGTACQLSTTGSYLTTSKSFYEEFPGPPTHVRSCISLRTDHGGGAFRFAPNTGSGFPGVIGSAAGSTTKSAWTACTSYNDTWALVNGLVGKLQYYSGTLTDNWIADVWLEFKYTPVNSASAADGVAKTGDVYITRGTSVTKGASRSGALTRGGTVTRTGAARLSASYVAGVEVGREVTADFDGWSDDASGTITGTPAALIERPDHFYHHQLVNYCGFPAADIGASFAAAGTFFATNSYAFAVLINQPIQAAELFLRQAVQCRSRFLVSLIGEAKLIVRQLGQSSVRSLTRDDVCQGSMAMGRSAADDIVNKFTIRWDRDWRQSGDQAYRGSTPFNDATSEGIYGAREPSRPDLFNFDAVSISAMVDQVGAYWLSFLKDARYMPEFGLALDNLDVEPGDIIDLTHPLDAMSGFTVEVLKLRHQPGSAKRKLADRLDLVTVEN